MKKILILTYRYPFKNGLHCSFGQNIFYEALKRNFIVKGVCFGDKDENDDNFISVKRETVIVKKISNMLFQIPIRQTHYQSKLFKKCFEELLLSYKPDIIYVEHTAMMQYIKNKYPSIKIFFYDDESSLYIKANKLLHGIREQIKNLFMGKAERKAINTSDVIFTISDQERIFLKEKFSYKAIETLHYGIDTSYYYYNWKPDADKIKILFLGNYEHYPNVEAVKFISTKLAKHFQRDKKFEFIIVGRNVKNIKKFVNYNVKIYSDVKDVREFYWTSTIFIAPIFYGGGLRTKILEAAACGIPLIITPLANNGLNLENNKSAFIAEDFEGFIKIITELSITKNNRILQGISANARKIMEDRFNPAIVSEKLENIFKDN